jgi:hypothetical protein
VGLISKVQKLNVEPVKAETRSPDKNQECLGCRFRPLAFQVQGSRLCPRGPLGKSKVAGQCEPIAFEITSGVVATKKLLSEAHGLPSTTARTIRPIAPANLRVCPLEQICQIVLNGRHAHWVFLHSPSGSQYQVFTKSCLAGG